MASVNGVPSVYICANGISFALIPAESICLVSAGMCSQDSVFVDVVRVCPTAAWVVRREAQGVEILSYGDNRVETVVMGVEGRRKPGLDELADY